MSRNEILSPSLLRMDGRRPYELRSLEMHFSPHLVASSSSSSSRNFASSSSTLEQPDGSARLVQGLNDVTCCVFGPRDGSGGAASGSGEGASVEFEVLNENASQVGQERRANRARNDRRTQETTSALASLFTPILSLHLYPRTSSILVSLLVTSSDGSLLSTLINAATLALVAAGVPMKDYCLATTVAFHPPLKSSHTGGEDPVLLDPTSAEENDLPHLTVAVTPRDGNVGLSTLDAGRGKVQGDRVVQGLKVAVKVVSGALLDEVEMAVKGWAKGLRDAGLEGARRS